MSTNEARAIGEAAERLTWDAICKRFPDEWVVVTDVEWENEGDVEFAAALVLGHYKRRKEASPHIKTAFRSHSEIGCYWTGQIRGPVPRVIVA